MAGNTFGRLFRITTWGESHGPGIGVVIDGCPPGLALDETVVQGMLETTTLRRVLWLLSQGQPVPVDLWSRAGRQSMTVPVRHCVLAGVLVNLYCIPAACLYMAFPHQF